jgi:O-acetylhomoserine (thiol)-lyase
MAQLTDTENAPTLRFETVAVHTGANPDGPGGSLAVPVHLTTAYPFRDTDHARRLFDLAEPGYIYTRIMNPTQAAFEERVAALEGGVGGLALASGQAAITLTVLGLASAGDNIVSTTSLYGGTQNLFAYTLPRYGIATRFVKDPDAAKVAAAIDERTRAVYLETIGNPRLDVPDIQAIADAAHARGVPLVIDNTFASPALCRPVEHGADIIVHSATKFIGGHGNAIGGVIVDAGKFDWAASGRFPGFTEPDPTYHGVRYTETFGPAAFIVRTRVQLLRDMGPAISPLNAFLFLNGLETLALRMRRVSDSALEIARRLAADPRVTWVRYPTLPGAEGYDVARRYLPDGGGAILTFGVRGGREAGERLVNALRLYRHVANVGDTRSLVIHPASTTHSQLDEAAQRAAGVTPDLVRLSIGLEHVEDLWADLDAGLGAAQG